MVIVNAMDTDEIKTALGKKNKNKSGGISITFAIVTCLMAASIPLGIDNCFAFLIYTLIRLLIFPGMNDVGIVFCVCVCI